MRRSMRSCGLLLLVLSAQACVNAATDVAPGAGPSATGTSVQNDLRVDLSFDQAAFAAYEPVTATVTLTNTSNQNLTLLGWFVPTSDLETPAFIVTHGNAR